MVRRNGGVIPKCTLNPKPQLNPVGLRDGFLNGFKSFSGFGALRVNALKLGIWVLWGVAGFRIFTAGNHGC